MVSEEMSVSWMGAKGYASGSTSSSAASKKLNRFLTRNSAEARVMLLITRRPSSTMWGTTAKSAFSRVICATRAAASLPPAMAMEQSAAFSAGMSFTPVAHHSHGAALPLERRDQPGACPHGDTRPNTA